MFEKNDELTLTYSSSWDNPETKKIIEEMKSRGVIIDPKLINLGKPEVKEQPFLQKHKNHLLLLLLIVAGYLTYKTLKK